MAGEAPKSLKNEKVGEVVSTKMAKTIVVEVSRRVPHPLYKRIVGKRKKFYAHDETSDAKMGDIVRGIFELLRVERSTHPFRTGLRFRQLDTEELAHELLIAESRTEAGERRRDLRIEELRDAAHESRRQRIEIFAGAVHDHEPVRIGERRAEPVELDRGQRIDQRDALAEYDLDQRQPWEERVDAHELGIDAEHRRDIGHELEQGFGAVDPVAQGVPGLIGEASIA